MINLAMGYGSRGCAAGHSVARRWTSCTPTYRPRRA